MAQTIVLKSSATTSDIPTVGQLVLGELAVNTYDGKLFIKKDDGAESIIEIGTDAQSLSGETAGYYLDYGNFSNTPTIDAIPANGSTNAVQSDGVFDELAGKEDSLGFTPEDSANKGSANGYASLGADSKIPSSQLPALAITDVNTVADESAQLGLTAQEGDVAVRTDESKTYIHNGGSASTMADWSEMATPTDVVISVNGNTGAVTLTTSDITEGTNEYYTDAKVLSYVGGVLNDSGTGTSDLWSASKIDTYVTAAIDELKAVKANVDPTVNDDSDSNYYVGQVWVNDVSDEVFIAADVTVDTAIWQSVSGTGAGTISTGSNVGTSGVNMYKGVNGSALEFRSIIAASGRVSVALDDPNNEVEIDVVINDSGTSSSDLWSANKIITRIIDGGTF